VRHVQRQATGLYLFLDQRQLFKISFQESHLLLLRLRITVSNHVVVLLLDLVQLYLELDDLLTAIL
jgi:hypothetical protein